jgi:hypothetical protein
MMFAAMFLSILQAAAPVEVLPVDAQMAAYEAAFPRLADSDAEFQAHIGRLGPAEAGWSTSEVSVASAIATRPGDAEQHVLGEWVEGGHNVAAPGDRPLRAPSNFRRYSAANMTARSTFTSITDWRPASSSTASGRCAASAMPHAGDLNGSS